MKETLPNRYGNNAEFLAAMGQETESREVQAFNVPTTLDKPNVYGRESVLAKIGEALDPTDENSMSRRVLLLHGMAGVGKTTMALYYVQSSQDKFDRIFWISGKGLRKNSLRIAKCLCGYSGDDHVAALSVFRDWLSQTSNYFIKSCILSLRPLRHY
jgi:hypothetical protein